MKIGFACLTVGVPNTQMRTCRKASATPEKLMEIIKSNLEATEKIIDYSIKNGLKMYRLSSDLIPFGSDLSTNSLNWVELFAEEFERIGTKIKQHNIRVSMHPGQYTVLNSPDEGVVERAIADLEYHVAILEAMKIDTTHKIILHIGGVYGDKTSATERFIDTYAQLSDQVKARLIIENDDRLYTIEDVLGISQITGAPIVYDNLHNACNLSDPSKNDAYWIELAQKTWSAVDGPAKVHYSQQREGGRLGAHTSTIYLKPFMDYFNEVAHLEVDIMLEVKDKNLSAIKCHLATTKNPAIKDLEKEWGRYKYAVLMHSPQNYQSIRQLLKDKESYPVAAFYHLIEEALATPPTQTVQLNALDHIWGHLKQHATSKETERYRLMKAQWFEGTISLNRLKNWLQRSAAKYDDHYLLQSLFFELD